MSHRDRIVEQFTRQAEPFSNAPGIRDERALTLLVEAAGAGGDDTVLDVACGPGLVVCAFARVAREVTGIDVTPAMIERARALVGERGMTNVRFEVGDVLPLPYPGGAFSLVVSRFAFHHFLEPAAVLAEMRRVCVPGGRVVVADATPPTDKAAAFDHMEKLRDPSHVRALPLAELRALFAAAGLREPRETFYRLEAELEGLLSRSFPDPGDVAELRRIFVDAVADDALGMDVRRVDDQIRLSYPVSVLVADRS